MRPSADERAICMFDVIGAQLPWWVAGPGVGLCVVALYGLINARLGVSGAWLATIAPVEGWRPEPWRRTFLLALAGGCIVAALLGPPVGVHGYGRLSEALPPVALVPVLLLAGVALGYGSRWAGGCTSGHGMSGCAAASPDSVATTATFFTVAVAVTLGLNALTGGAL
jgi:uncharacterized membrane protein YedE/YeeE